MKEIGPFAADIRRYATEAERAIAPAPLGWLRQRLTAMQVMMTSGWSEAKATLWLTETARLLADLPQDIVGEAIDAAIRTSKFLPTVAEIRLHADDRFTDRQRSARRLRSMADFKPTPRATAPVEPEGGYCPPEEAAKIVEEFGLRLTEDKPTRRHAGPPRMPTAEDYAAMGVTIGGTDDL